MGSHKFSTDSRYSVLLDSVNTDFRLVIREAVVTPHQLNLLTIIGPHLVLQTIHQLSCSITEESPTRAFPWLKAATIAFTYKNLKTLW